jgi:RNA recognition motif-containing protein
MRHMARRQLCLLFERNVCVSTSIYVSNLAASTTEEALATKFREFGTVLSVKIGRDPDNGRPKSCGFVEMKTPDEARVAARSLNATRLDGRVLSVHRAARS